MFKKSFLIFILVMASLITSLILFFQSPLFARLVKKVSARYVPTSVGLKIDFSQLSMQMFPPGVSFLQPQITISENTVLETPLYGTVRADRLDVTFLPFQTLSGLIRIHEASVVKGQVDLKVKSDDLPKAPKEEIKNSGIFSSIDFDWDFLVKVFIDSVGFEESTFRIEYEINEKQYEAKFSAKQLNVSQNLSRSGPEVEVLGDIHTIESDHPQNWPLPRRMDGLRFNILASKSRGQVREFKFTQKNAVLDITGEYEGNILKDKKLPTKGQVQIHAPVRDALDPFRGVSLIDTIIDQASGNVDGTVAFQMNMNRTRETLQMKADLKFHPVQWQNFSADVVQLSGEWASAGEKMGPIKVSKLIAESSIRDFVASPSATSTGGGGRVEFQPFVIDPQMREPLQARAKLENAHLHWFVGPALKALYPLDFRASGSISLLYFNDKASVEVDLNFPKLILSNQKYGVPRPYRKGLEIGTFGLRGTALWDKTGLTLQKVEADSPSGTKMVAYSEPITSDKLEIRASGFVEGADIPSLGGIPFKGSGVLDLRVRGTPKDLAIEFRPNLKGVEYLNLQFGDCRGLITYLDSRSRLEFHNVQAQQGSLVYDGSGYLDLSDHDSIGIDIQVRKGDASDFSKVFSHFTESYWWYPHTVRGNLSGEVRVSGRPDLKYLKVLGRINGREWRFKGERFSEVYLEGGLDEGAFVFPKFRLRKRTGEVFGHVKFSADKVWDWDIRSSSFSLQEFDRISSFNVPVQASLNFQSSGKGKFESLTGQTTVEVSEAKLRSLVFPSSRLAITLQKGKVDADASVFGGQMSSTLRYALDAGKESSLKAHWKDFDFTPLLIFVNPRLAEDDKTKGTLSGKLAVQFKSQGIEFGDGELQVSQYRIAKTGAEFWIDEPFNVNMRDGSFKWLNSSQNRPPNLISQKSKLELALGADKGKWTGGLHGTLDASFFEWVHPLVVSGKGMLDVDLNVFGPLKSPSWEGNAEINGGSLRLRILESLLLENLTGRVQIRDQRFSFQRIETDLSGGRSIGSGHVDLYLSKDPTLQASLQLIGPKLKIFPFQMLKVNGTVSVTGEQRPYLVQGSVRSDSGLSREKFFQSSGMGARDSVLYQPKPRADQLQEHSTFAFNISAESPGGIQFQNDLLDAEVKGQMKIVGTSDIPRPLGTAEVVEGKLFFKDHQFVIQSGSVLFESTSALDPAFSLTAQTEVSGTKVQMTAQGKKSKNKVEFSSNPPLAESEILSLLAFGSHQEDARRLGGRGDRGVYQPGEAASLLLHSMEFNREFQSKTGIQIQLDEAVNTQQGTSAFQRANDAEAGASPKIVFRRPIGRRFSLSVGSTVGVGTGSQREVNAEVKVTPGFSLIGVWDTMESLDASRRDSFGVDLKVQKRFK